LASNSSTSRLGQFTNVWARREEIPVGEWVQLVSTAYFNCNLSVIAAAELVEAQPAELEAALALASLEDNSLEIISKYNPPATTWFFIAECPNDHLVELLEEIKVAHSNDSPAERAQQLMRRISGPTLSDKIASLDSKAFTHLAKKSEQYNALNEKHRKALRDFGSRLKRGQSLTAKQVTYAHGLIRQLAELNVISKNSPDDDSEIMEKLLMVLEQN
jgi:hypothetical protein